MFDRNVHPLPELLCPAGSPEALDAAIEGGADAVYLGGSAFNARMNAHNFGGDALRSAVLRAHAFGVKVYLTLNTLVTDRELPRAVEAAREAYLCGIDALIVADLGAAATIHEAIPDFELHASTQCAGHNTAAAAELKKLGFSRMVIARETSREDMQRFLAEKGITDLQSYFQKFVNEYNKTAVPYKKIGLLKVRDEEFPKNTLRKILRRKIDMTID